MHVNLNKMVGYILWGKMGHPENCLFQKNNVILLVQLGNRNLIYSVLLKVKLLLNLSPNSLSSFGN